MCSTRLVTPGIFSQGLFLDWTWAQPAPTHPHSYPQVPADRRAPACSPSGPHSAQVNQRRALLKAHCSRHLCRELWGGWGHSLCLPEAWEEVLGWSWWHWDIYCHQTCVLPALRTALGVAWGASHKHPWLFDGQREQDSWEQEEKVRAAILPSSPEHTARLTRPVCSPQRSRSLISRIHRAASLRGSTRYTVTRAPAWPAIQNLFPSRVSVSVFPYSLVAFLRPGNSLVKVTKP